MLTSLKADFLASARQVSPCIIYCHSVYIHCHWQRVTECSVYVPHLNNILSKFVPVNLILNKINIYILFLYAILSTHLILLILHLWIFAILKRNWNKGKKQNEGTVNKALYKFIIIFNSSET